MLFPSAGDGTFFRQQKTRRGRPPGPSHNSDRYVFIVEFRNVCQEKSWSGRRCLPEHDPEKWVPVFGKRSCSNKEVEQDDDSKKNHPALLARRRARTCASSTARCCFSRALFSFGNRPGVNHESGLRKRGY